jgi:putative transport protein
MNLTEQLLVLLAVIATGLLLGRLHIAGLTLGSSGVIFTGLAFGHFGYRIPEGIGLPGLVLFVYCVGLRAGPAFFRSFVRQGRSLAKLAVLLTATGAAVTWALARLLRLPTDLAAGIFAGAMTSTPALAAALEKLPAGSQAAVGYGLAYPFGVVGVVLAMELLPRLLRQNLRELDKQLAAQEEAGRQIVRVLVEVLNPAVIGKRLSELDMIAEHNCQVPRLLRGNRLLPVSSDVTLEAGQHVLVVGHESRVPVIVNLLGRPSEKTDYIMDTERERRQVVATSRNVVGRTLADLKPMHNFGVTISRILRHELEFVPRMRDEIQYGDALVVVGEPENIEKFAEFAGHRARSFDETDLVSLAVGLIAGVLLGMVSFGFGKESFSLGLAGGPLFVALLVGHFGRIGPVVGHFPRAALMLAMEAGLVCFLADAGVRAGQSLMGVLGQYGLRLSAASLAVVLVPMAVGCLAGRFLLKMNFLEILGGVAGGMTSTPGLAVVTAKTDSEIPVVSYAAAYPVALILMTVLAQALVAVLR